MVCTISILCCLSSDSMVGTSTGWGGDSNSAKISRKQKQTERKWKWKRVPSHQPRCAPGSWSWARWGWPHRYDPPRRCSAPPRGGWGSLRCPTWSWCVSWLTGSPLGRLRHRRGKSEVHVVGFFSHLTCQHHKLSSVIRAWVTSTHRGIPGHIRDSPAQASRCTAGARLSSPDPTAGVWPLNPWWRSSPSRCGIWSSPWICREWPSCVSSPVWASIGDS